jgi:hypothetical protein
MNTKQLEALLNMCEGIKTMQKSIEELDRRTLVLLDRVRDCEMHLGAYDYDKWEGVYRHDEQD